MKKKGGGGGWVRPIYYWVKIFDRRGRSDRTTETGRIIQSKYRQPESQRARETERERETETERERESEREREKSVGSQIMKTEKNN